MNFQLNFSLRLRNPHIFSVLCLLALFFECVQPNSALAAYCCCLGPNESCEGGIPVCQHPEEECNSGGGGTRQGSDDSSTEEGGGELPGDDNGNGRCDACEVCDLSQDQSCQPARINLIIDSDNSNTYSIPSEAQNECEPDEGSEERNYGKLILATNGDWDDDGIPDFADGIVGAPGLMGTETQRQLDLQETRGLGERFVPMILTVSGNQNPRAAVQFSYASSDPMVSFLLNAEPAYSDYGDEQSFRFHTEGGFFRIWRDKTNLNAHHLSLDREGSFVPSGENIPVQSLFGGAINGTTILYVQALAAPEFIDENNRELTTIGVRLVNSGNVCPRDKLEDAVRATPFEVTAVDLHHWQPQWTPGPDTSSFGDGTLSLRRSSFSIPSESLRMDFPRAENIVNGAITDGASAVVIDIRPRIDDLSNLDIRIDRRNDHSDFDNTQVDFPEIFGGFSDFRDSDNRVRTPNLPIPRTRDWTKEYHRQRRLLHQQTLYIPPRNFMTFGSTKNDGLFPRSWNAYITANDNDPRADMDFNLIRTSDGKLLGAWNFKLRRPPLLLVHGIRVGPSSWGTQSLDNQSGPWEVTSEAWSTRLYRANWELTNTLGFDANFATIGKYTNHIIDQYRNGGVRDSLLSNPNPALASQQVKLNGNRYAATRIDVVGHSQGGQLVRTYMSDIDNSAQIMQRTGNGNLLRVNYNVPELVSSVIPGWPSLPSGYPLLHIQREGVDSRSPEGNQPYFRSDNLGAGDFRRVVAMASPFKGSFAADLAVRLFDPNSIFVRYQLQRGNESLGAAQEIASKFQRYTPPSPFILQGNNLTYSTPVCTADLASNSPMAHALEQSRYPNGAVIRINNQRIELQNKAVPWIPIVGIALRQLHSSPSGLSLNKALSNATFMTPLSRLISADSSRINSDDPFWMRWVTPWLNERGYLPTQLLFLPSTGDMVVSGYSQRNALPPQDINLDNYKSFWRNPVADGVVGSPNSDLGATAENHIHSDTPEFLYRTLLELREERGLRLPIEEQKSLLIRDIVITFLNASDNLPRHSDRWSQLQLSENITFSVAPETLANPTGR